MIKKFAEWWFDDGGVPEVFKFFIFVIGLLALFLAYIITDVTHGIAPLIVLGLVGLYYAFNKFLRSQIENK